MRFGLVIGLKAYLASVKKVKAYDDIEFNKFNSKGEWEWKDEVGSPQDVKELGEFMADLLTKNHYDWVTNKQELFEVLRHWFPPLETQSQEGHGNLNH